MERIQRNYTSKIRGLEHMYYHERLKKFGIIQSGEKNIMIPHNKCMATAGGRQGECAKPQNRQGKKVVLYMVSDNIH